MTCPGEVRAWRWRPCTRRSRELWIALLDGDGNVCGEISKSANQVETYMKTSVK